MMQEIEREMRKRVKMKRIKLQKRYSTIITSKTSQKNRKGQKAKQRRVIFLQLFTANHEIYKRAKTVTQDDCFREDIHWQIVVCPLGQRLLPVFEWNETNFHNLLILCRFLKLI